MITLRIRTECHDTSETFGSIFKLFLNLLDHDLLADNLLVRRLNLVAIVSTRLKQVQDLMPLIPYVMILVLQERVVKSSDVCDLRGAAV